MQDSKNKCKNLISSVEGITFLFLEVPLYYFFPEHNYNAPICTQCNMDTMRGSIIVDSLKQALQTQKRGANCPFHIKEIGFKFVMDKETQKFELDFSIITACI